MDAHSRKMWKIHLLLIMASMLFMSGVLGLMMYINYRNCGSVAVEPWDEACRPLDLGTLQNGP